MPFDPNLPAPQSPLDSAVVRGQFNGLKEFIDLLNARQITGAVVESVGTGNAGDPASVGLSLVNGVLRFSFVLPRGDTGAAGQDGQNGQNGQDGQIGPVGPPFANAVVDAVTTVDAGQNASVNSTFDGTNVHFTFSIPRGVDGVQGPPGEVTNADLNNAIATSAASLLAQSSNNTNNVTTLDASFADPDLESLRGKLNDLIMALRRP